MALSEVDHIFIATAVMQKEHLLVNINDFDHTVPLLFQFV